MIKSKYYKYLIMYLSIERILWFTERMLRYLKEGMYIYWIGLKPFINLYKPELLEVRKKRALLV